MAIENESRKEREEREVRAFIGSQWDNGDSMYRVDYTQELEVFYMLVWRWYSENGDKSVKRQSRILQFPVFNPVGPACSVGRMDRGRCR